MLEAKIALARKKGQLFEERPHIPLEGRAEEYRRQVAANPGDPWLWRLYGYCLMIDHNLFRESQAAICTALTYDPLRYEYHIARGWNYLKLNRFEDAASSYRFAEALRRDDQEPLYHLAMCRFYLEDYAGAVAIYERMFAKDCAGANWPAVTHYCWVALMMLGRKEDAEAVLWRRPLTDEPAGEANPFGVVLYSPQYYIACLLYKRYIHPEALLVDASYQDPMYALVLKNFVAVYYDMIGNTERAIPLYEELFEAIGNETPMIYASVFARKRYRCLQEATDQKKREG